MMVMGFPAKKNAVAKKHNAVSQQEKMAFSSPYRVALGLPPFPRVCRNRWAYADVRIKISRIDRLPDFLTHGALLVHFMHWSSTNTERNTMVLTHLTSPSVINLASMVNCCNFKRITNE